VLIPSSERPDHHHASSGPGVREDNPASGEASAVFIGDRFLDPDEPARISLFDRGYLHGDAVFETLRTYRCRPFRLRAHLDRLLTGARILGIDPPLSVQQMIAVVDEAIARTALDAAHIRVTLSRGPGGPGLGASGCGSPLISVVAGPLRRYPPCAYREGIPTSAVSARRIPGACIPSTFKSANYLPAVLARRELDVRGQTEGLVLSVDGELVGGTVSNLFLVRAGELQTPWLHSSCLPGVTRAAVLELSSELGIRAREQRLELPDLVHADEAFFTNSLMELLPIRAVDGRRLRTVPGAVTERLRGALINLIERETEDDRSS
jgi:branched-chain amino acid aminotransferase